MAISARRLDEPYPYSLREIQCKPVTSSSSPLALAHWVCLLHLILGLGCAEPRQCHAKGLAIQPDAWHPLSPKSQVCQ
jgi:hypothetical protein